MNNFWAGYCIVSLDSMTFREPYYFLRKKTLKLEMKSSGWALYVLCALVHFVPVHGLRPLMFQVILESPLVWDYLNFSGFLLLLRLILAKIPLPPPLTRMLILFGFIECLVFALCSATWFFWNIVPYVTHVFLSPRSNVSLYVQYILCSMYSMGCCMHWDLGVNPSCSSSWERLFLSCLRCCG